MDFHITIVMDDPRHDPDLGEKLLEGFLAAGCEAVVDQDGTAQEATVVLWLSADDAASASGKAIEILHDVETSRALIPTAINVIAVDDRASQAA